MYDPVLGNDPLCEPGDVIALVAADYELSDWSYICTLHEWLRKQTNMRLIDASNGLEPTTDVDRWHLCLLRGLVALQQTDASCRGMIAECSHAHGSYNKF